jgi:hypothetical protein
VLDLGAARDEDVADDRRREEPVLEDPGDLVEAAGQLARIVEGAEVVGDHAAVGRRRRRGAHARLAEQPQRGGHPEAQQLERHGRPQRVDDLVRGGDHDEPRRRHGHDLLARVRAAAALDRPAVGRHLVGAVDRDVERVERLERLDDQPQLAGQALGGRRRGHAAQRQAALGQGRQQVAHRRPRSQADAHPVLDQRGGGLRRGALLALDLLGTHRKACPSPR